MRAPSPRNAVFALLIFSAVFATTAQATVTATPGTVSAFPTQTTPSVTLSLTFTATKFTSGSITVGGLPAGTTTVPAAVTYSTTLGATSASTSFAFAIGGGTAPGTYLISIRDNTNGAGGTTVTLVVNTPSFTATATPNPVTLTIGGSSQSVVVSTTPDPGFGASSISYSFSGFPAFIVNNGPQTSTLSTAGFPPVTFAFSLAAGATAGSYTGTLTGMPTGSTVPAPKSFPFTVIVQQPDIAATFTQPVVSMCNGQTINDNIQLSPLNGYSGTPKLAFISAPPGITLSPTSPVAVAMPPTETIPFSITANGATSGLAILNIVDSAAGINKNVQMQINIGVADFTPAITPGTISLTAGGSAQNVSASIAPTPCLSSSVSVTASGQPPGMTISANPSTILAPGFAAVPISIQASAAAQPGNYPITFTFTSGTISKSLIAAVSVGAAPDYSLSLNPASISLDPGASGATIATIKPVNGFNGTVNVTAPAIPGITFTPSTFSIAPGGSKNVTVSVGSSVAAAAFSAVFSSSATGVSGFRTATLQLTVAAPPSFVLTLTPNSLTLPAGGSASVTAAVTPVNGFNGTVSVTAPTVQGVTFSPSSFSITPATTQIVTVSVDPSAPAGTLPPQHFSASSPGVSGQGADLNLTIGARPDFTISAAPPSVSIRRGGSGSVTVTAMAANGFNGVITVNAPLVGGLTFDPATFTLSPGASRQVTINAAASAPAAGSFQATFTATAPGITSPHQATVTINILAPLPLLTSATPPALVVGSQATLVRIAGNNLEPGAQFHSSDPSLIVGSSNILSAQLADVQMTVRADAPAGPRSLTVTNPDGGTSNALVVLVYPSSSIAAPLDVLAAAIVFPAQGTMIAPRESVYPRGLLGTSGTGTIVGSWQFDGVPFDRFVVNAAGGMPVEVRTNIPLPNSFNGSHTITMVIESPRKFVSPAIEVVDSIDSASRLTLLAPVDGAILRGGEQPFRWSLVPNCSGYDVEIAPPGLSDRPDAVTPIVRFHVDDAEWHPSAADVAAIGPGIHRWRVQPRCAGETALQPSGWQRFAFLPDHVDISLQPSTTNEHGARVVHWTSGVTGLLYRVEFLSPEGRTIFSALTPATDYVVPRTLPPGTTVRVSAIAPDGRTLGTSSVSPLSLRRAREAIALAQQTVIELGAVQPADGSTITTPQPHIEAQWKGAAPADQVMLLVDNTDMTQVAKVTPTSVSYDSLIALAPGEHSAAVAVAGNIKRWTFTVAGAAGLTAAAAPAPVQQPRGDWVVTPVGTITLVSAVTHDVRAQLSALTDLNEANLANKSTGDVSLRHNLESNQTVQESRNWVTDFGGHQGDRLKEDAVFGFGPPDFFDQAQLMSAGLPRGGVEAKMSVPIGSLSYYQTFTAQPAGVVTGLFGPDQRIRAAAYRIPTSQRWDFRVIGMNVSESPGVNSDGGKGRALSVFARFTLGPALNAIFEGAHGDFTPNAGSFEPQRKGNAFRLGLNGMRGTLNYALNLQHTQADFVNPANRAFTPAGVPDRTGGDLTIGKIIGFTSVSLQLRHMQDGVSTNLLVPRTRENGGMASLMRMFGSHVSLSLSGNLTKDKGEGTPALDLPGADRNQSGGTGTLSEFFGRFNFSQTVSQQILRDHANSLNDSTTTATTLTSGGQLTPHLNLSAVLSGTHTNGNPTVGKTDQYLVALQPMVTVPVLFLTLQPRASYSTSENSIVPTTTTEDYQWLMTFAPQWMKSMFSMQLSGEWTRNRSAGQIASSPFIHRYAATFIIHSRDGAGPAYANGALMPMAAPVAATNPASSKPGPPK